VRTLTIRHNTVYSYARPVTFGEHRLMLRPRDSHDLRLVNAGLVLSPGGTLRWMHDVFGNSVALASFDEPAAELRIESTLIIERYALKTPTFELEPNARHYPFIYSADDRTDLGRTLERHYPDPKGELDAWARAFVASYPTDTLALLADLNATIRERFTYSARQEEGTQTPLETLERGAGTCRDFALLFIEAARSLGFGARFVTGYLYDPALDGDSESATQGAGATHAWGEVYLPGAGWVEYDPTNGIIAGENLIRIAVTRDPSQAIPVGGSFDGDPMDFTGMTVEVEVTAAGRIQSRPAA
jgi:transglutaminase-like putative cysteine protease